jgi:DNA ligase (NAD+)
VDIQIRVTPKLDGYAAYDDGVTLYTRGDGYKGQDITRAFDRGLKVANNGLRGLGPGEIVIKKSYFDKFLSVFFENSRNIQAAIIAEKNVDSHVQKAIDDGACVFYPFELLKNRTEHFSVIMSHFDEVIHSVWGYVGYDIDGVVLEVTNEKIKQYMGATRRHHRWQIAFKINDDSADVKVINVIPQTSRTGRVSPVAKLVPTKLSGVTISRVTVHHYRMVLENGVGSGATVRIIRSGLVIPKIEKVIKKVTPHIPSHCPSCNSLLVWEADHLVCTNKGDCPAQTENTLMYFFKMLGNNDGFGPKVIEKLNNFGIKYIHEIYSLTENDFIQYGFGEKTSQNLVDQLKSSRKIEVEDWRFLAAFGISRLGAGNCEKLLGHYSLVNVFDLGVDEVMSIDGFGQVSAQAITSGLLNMKEEFFQVYSLGFTIRETLNLIKKGIISPISDMLVVFSGTMKKKSRRDMEEEAKSLGAKVAKSVTGKTKYLVIGDRVGETKLTSAKDLGVEILSEQDYINLIESYI